MTQPGTCRVCRGVIDPVLVSRLDRTGLHPTCEETSPTSTVAELGHVLIAYDASRPRSKQTNLGPSELGHPCDQQIVRKIAGLPRRPVTAPAWAPLQGTAMHAQMEHVVAYWNQAVGYRRWYAEDELVVDVGTRTVPPIIGAGDAYDRDYDMVVDWKLVGVSTLNKVRQAQQRQLDLDKQVPAQYRKQAHLYGYGHLRKGRAVQYVRLVFLARTHKYADSLEWTEPFDVDTALDCITRYHELYDLAMALDIANKPEGLTLINKDTSDCDFCPFRNPTANSAEQGCRGDEAKAAKQVAALTEGLIP